MRVENDDGLAQQTSSDDETRKPISRVPSYIRLTPRRAVASFENLVALANHQERLKEARKIVWRDRGEPAAELTDVWECIEHAGRGGLRAHRISDTFVHSDTFPSGAGAIAFAIRASVNLVLATLRFGRVPK